MYFVFKSFTRTFLSFNDKIIRRNFRKTQKMCPMKNVNNIKYRLEHRTKLKKKNEYDTIGTKISLLFENDFHQSTPLIQNSYNICESPTILFDYETRVSLVTKFYSLYLRDRSFLFLNPNPTLYRMERTFLHF